MTEQNKFREIPYNYTSFSDKEIILRYLDVNALATINALRQKRKTGRSARMLFEILGDMWVIDRNPYIQDDLITHRKRWASLTHALHHRLDAIVKRANDNETVNTLIVQIRQAINDFVSKIEQQKKLRKKVSKKLFGLIRKDNICFDGLSRISHATDASDWRIEYPLVVLKPAEDKKIPAIVKACQELGLTIITRGGGTGYTGGVIPLYRNTVVINLEKLDHLQSIEWKNLPGLTQKIPTITVGAGVVTRRVAEKAQANHLIFAVDPTSQDASTIGGNIAMNAGGKKAVLYGTTLDNLASWKLITAKGQWLLVERINHNLGKIHLQDMAEFRLSYFSSKTKKLIGTPSTLKIPGASLRKVGLGKDVTDKFLSGLPGIQKEGCDGIITEATFILHQQLKHIRTFCLEYFGSDLNQAVSSIVEIKKLLDYTKHVELAGLEHLDERYVKAVNYSTKAPRDERPKMVLLGDVVSDDDNILANITSQIIRLANNRNAEGFIAISREARDKFWLDRSRTAAIAAHTNAFKINEDVVIPLNNLAKYNDFIERLNIEQSIFNKLEIISNVVEYLSNYPVSQQEEQKSILQEKINLALKILNTTAENWQLLVTNLDESAKKLKLHINAEIKFTRTDTIFELMQTRELRISYRREIEKSLKKIFTGEEFKSICQTLDDIHRKIRYRRIFIATHMHAGDGNVHTNIPLHSNDYQMMQEAEKIVARIMKKAVELDGVISGEHGIGITKMPFLQQETIDAFIKYKNDVDPNQVFNRDKLIDVKAINKAFTPSFSLLEQEALILQASELGELNFAIKDCLRCGKCKPKCQTHIPRANLFYSPRDKILGTGAIIEAFLYEEQTRRGISLQHFSAMNDIADHCTVCHHCLPPCPVNIDFGDVTIKMRQILKAQGKKRVSVGTRLSLAYLNATNPLSIKILRLVLLRLGFKMQRAFHRLTLNMIKPTKLPQATTGKPKIQEQVIHFLKKPLPSDIVTKPIRSLLGIEDNKMIPILRDSKKVNDNSEAIFYFPGCGSERLFSKVGLATLATLYHLGIQIVLPPGYMCCGYPQSAEGDKVKGDAISTQNRVLFHRIANTLNYLDIKTVIVSCGTCIDQLQNYHFDKIFSECRLLDIHEYLMQKNFKLENKDQAYLYHDPCHSPIKQYEPLSVAKALLGENVVKSNRCCGDAGTLSMSRPDIATQLRYRKEKEIIKSQHQLNALTKTEQTTYKMLTTCPACVKGLATYQPKTGIETHYIVEELALQLLGENWLSEFLARVQQGGIERVLL